MRLLISAGLLAVWPWAVEAGTAVSKVATYELADSVITLDMHAAELQPPSCNSSKTFVVDAATDFASNLVTLVATTRRGGLTLKVTGTGKCTLVVGAEDIKSIEVSGSPFE